MTEPHVYSEGGITYERVFCVPNAAIDSNLNPFSATDFTDKTRDSRGTVGDLFDRSKEMSEKRKSKEGYDPLEKKYKANWSKKRKGRNFPDPNQVFEI